MASHALERVGEARLAGAIARLLRWEAQLLARRDHDAASRSAALRGLEWAADFARALEAEPCAAWLDALRERAAERPGHTPGAWSALGAPACAELAARLEELHTLAPLAPEARGWRGMATAVRAYEDVPEAPPAPAVAPPAASDSPGPPAPVTRAGVDLASPPYRFGDRVRIPEDTRVEGDPVLLREFMHVLADWVGPYGVQVESKGGRLELSGARPGEHADPTRLAPAALEALRLLHLAAGRVAAPLVVADPEEGAVRWSIRLPAAEGARHLFAEAGGQRLALPWHAVVTYGLGEGGRPHVVLGRGLERVAVALDWLHGLGPGARHAAEAPRAITFDTPALAAVPYEIESDDGGRFAEVVLLPVAPAPAPAPAAPETTAAPAPAPAAPVPAAPPETVQNAAPPADIPERSVPGPPVALVADDSFTARVFLRRLLAMRGVEVDEAEDGDQARERLAARTYDLVFLDADMPGGGALAVTGAPGAATRNAVVLVRDDAERAAALAAGFAHVLYKPFAEDEVAAALAALAEESRPGA